MDSNHDRWVMATQFWWAVHNLIAHPLSEILYWFGLQQASNWIHDKTVPEHKPGEGRG